MTRPQDPVLPSTVGITTLLVAARWALLRSLNTRLWDAPAGERAWLCRWVAATGSHRQIRSSRRCLPNKAELDQHVRQVQSRRPKASLGRTAKTTVVRQIFLAAHMHGQAEHNQRTTSPCTATAQRLMQPFFSVSLLGAIGHSDGASLCVPVSKQGLIYRRAGIGRPTSSLGCGSGEEPRGAAE